MTTERMVENLSISHVMTNRILQLSMWRYNFIILLCVLITPTAYSRRFAEIKGLHGDALQGALMLDELIGKNLSHDDETQVKKNALALIEANVERSDPAATFLLGLIYFEESPRYSIFYHILYDRWSHYHYDPYWGDPDPVIIEPDLEDFLFVKTPLSYIEYCLDNSVEKFTYAAEHGYEYAMYCLGLIYASHQYGFNRTLSIKYYNEAVEHGSAEACAALGSEYFFGGNIVDYDFEKAVKYLSKAIQLGDKSDENYLYLGFCYEKGYGVQQDYKKAVEIYSSAPDNSSHINKLGGMVGNFSIPTRLGILYYAIDEVRDYDKAFKYLKAVADQNIREVGDVRGYVLRCLSACYRFGRGTDVDLERADFYLREAGKFGNIDAQKALEYLGLK